MLRLKQLTSCNTKLGRNDVNSSIVSRHSLYGGCSSLFGTSGVQLNTFHMRGYKSVTGKYAGRGAAVKTFEKTVPMSKIDYDSIPMNSLPFLTFSKLGVASNIWPKLQERGFRQPTSIQLAALPHLLPQRSFDKTFKGNDTMSSSNYRTFSKRTFPDFYDLIIQDMTGSGKTLSYAVPLLQSIDMFSDTLQGIVLLPTRELCIQVGGLLSSLAEETSKGDSKVKVLRCNGKPNDALLNTLHAHPPHILVTTPDTLNQLMNNDSAEQQKEKLSKTRKGGKSTRTLRNIEKGIENGEEEEEDYIMVSEDAVDLQKMQNSGLHGNDRAKVMLSESAKGANKENEKKMIKSLKVKEDDLVKEDEQNDTDAEAMMNEDYDEAELDSDFWRDSDMEQSEAEVEMSEHEKIENQVKVGMQRLQKKWNTYSLRAYSHERNLIKNHFKTGGGLDMSKVRHLVLDEADAMVQESYWPSLRQVLLRAELVRKKQLHTGLQGLPKANKFYQNITLPLRMVFCTATVTVPMLHTVMSCAVKPHIITGHGVNGRSSSLLHNYETGAIELKQDGKGFVEESWDTLPCVQTITEGWKAKSAIRVAAKKGVELPNIASLKAKVEAAAVALEEIEQRGLQFQNESIKALLERQKNRLIPQTIRHYYLVDRIPARLYDAQWDKTVRKQGIPNVYKPRKQVLDNEGEAVKMNAALTKLDDLAQYLRHQANLVNRVMSSVQPNGTLLFVNNSRHMAELALALSSSGKKVALMNNQCSKEMRKKAVDDLANGRVDLVQSTAMGSRGVDWKKVNLVINLGLCPDTVGYLHRAGRTDRMLGKQHGAVVTIVEDTAEDQYVDVKERLLDICDAPIEASLMAQPSGPGVSSVSQLSWYAEPQPVPKAEFSLFKKIRALSGISFVQAFVESGIMMEQLNGRAITCNWDQQLKMDRVFNEQVLGVMTNEDPSTLGAAAAASSEEEGYVSGDVSSDGYEIPDMDVDIEFDFNEESESERDIVPMKHIKDLRKSNGMKQIQLNQWQAGHPYVLSDKYNNVVVNEQYDDVDHNVMQKELVQREEKRILNAGVLSSAKKEDRIKKALAEEENRWKQVRLHELLLDGGVDFVLLTRQGKTGQEKRKLEKYKTEVEDKKNEQKTKVHTEWLRQSGLSEEEIVKRIEAEEKVKQEAVARLRAAEEEKKNAKVGNKKMVSTEEPRKVIREEPKKYVKEEPKKLMKEEPKKHVKENTREMPSATASAAIKAKLMSKDSEDEAFISAEGDQPDMDDDENSENDDPFVAQYLSQRSEKPYTGPNTFKVVRKASDRSSADLRDSGIDVPERPKSSLRAASKPRRTI